jgi:hypothetical protein
VRLWLLNRLDSATSGVILVSADEALATAVRLHFRQSACTRFTTPSSSGSPACPDPGLARPAGREKRGGHIRTSTAGHIPAESRMSGSCAAALGHGTTHADPARAHDRTQPPAARAMRQAAPADRRRPDLRDFARNREFAKCDGRETAVPALTGDGVRLRLRRAQLAFCREGAAAGRVHHGALQSGSRIDKAIPAGHVNSAVNRSAAYFLALLSGVILPGKPRRLSRILSIIPDNFALQPPPSGRLFCFQPRPP